MTIIKTKHRYLFIERKPWWKRNLGWILLLLALPPVAIKFGLLASCADFLGLSPQYRQFESLHPLFEPWESSFTEPSLERGHLPQHSEDQPQRAASPEAEGKETPDPTLTISDNAVSIPPTATVEGTQSADPSSIETIPAGNRDLGPFPPEVAPPTRKPGTSEGPTDKSAQLSKTAAPLQQQVEHPVDLFALRHFCSLGAAFDTLNETLPTLEINGHPWLPASSTLILPAEHQLCYQRFLAERCLVVDYEVKKGDHLTAISLYYNIPFNYVIDLNHFSNANVLLIGQKIKLPCLPADYQGPNSAGDTQQQE